MERQSFCGYRIYVCTPKKEEDLKPYITKGNHHAAAVVNTPKKEEKEATSSDKMLSTHLSTNCVSAKQGPLQKMSVASREFPELTLQQNMAMKMNLKHLRFDEVGAAIVAAA
ncbi:hypothetical protein Gorai_019837, partial [Gossypium raimondii]|nr:hypothetical protein [Gossypium raimondii]